METETEADERLPNSFSTALMRNPKAVARLLDTHTQDSNGLCRGCPRDAAGTLRQTWPCSLRLYAAAAEQRMRTPNEAQTAHRR